jgi:hypothetical protein
MDGYLICKLNCICQLVKKEFLNMPTTRFNKLTGNFFIKIASLLAPFLVLILVWFPELEHYYVPNGYIDDATIMKLREAPEKNVLKEISGMPLLATRIYDLHVQDQADRILAGEVFLPSQSPMQITLPFDPEDLDKGTSSWQLFFAGLSAVRILLEAYEQSAENKYFDQAKAMLLAWADYESSAWLPRGYLWNDHAVAARLIVLSQFWGIYRVRSDFDEDAARSILGFAVRSAKMLAKPAHFTYATNHGVMQNLGLLHAAVAFPELSDAEQFQQVAIERLKAQMKFYINNEGVVLEHSAGYHADGVYFLGMALRYLSLLDQQIPKEWLLKYEKAKQFYANMIRPDNSIPVFGDTQRDHDARKSLITESHGDHVLPLSLYKTPLPPQSDFLLYPSAGYAILWNGLDHWQDTSGVAQTTMLWSYYPKHGHKLADEMSILMWADGQDWWSNIGYWPYSEINRQQAESWNGSNAPHLVGETSQMRRTQLRYYGHNSGLNVVDLERVDEGGFQPRRQMIHTGQNLWLVLDSTKDKQNRLAEHLWTTLPELNVSQDSDSGGFWLTPATGLSRLQVALLGSKDVSMQRLSGSTEPFAGWMVMAKRRIEKTETFLVSQPSDLSWSLAVWKLVNEKDDSRLTAQPKMIRWDDQEHWELVIPLSSGEITIQRQGTSVDLIGNTTRQKINNLNLVTGPDVENEFQALQHEINGLATQYPRYRQLTRYRWKISYVIVVLLLLQVVVFWLVRNTRVGIYMRYSSVLFWLVVGIWLESVYFAN